MIYKDGDIIELKKKKSGMIELFWKDSLSIEFWKGQDKFVRVSWLIAEPYEKGLVILRRKFETLFAPDRSLYASKTQEPKPLPKQKGQR